MVGPFFGALKYLLFPIAVFPYKGKARAREGRGWEGQREEEERYPVDV